MTSNEAESRNSSLRNNQEPQRWVLADWNSSDENTKQIEIPAAVEFDESQCGGAFDGFTVTSDADPGL